MVRLINGTAYDNTRKRSTHPASRSSRKMVRYIAAYHTRQYSKTFDTSSSKLWPKLLSLAEFARFRTSRFRSNQICAHQRTVRLINGTAYDNTRKRSTHPASRSSRKMVRYIAAYHTRQYSKTFDTSSSKLWPKLLSLAEISAEIGNVRSGHKEDTTVLAPMHIGIHLIFFPISRKRIATKIHLVLLVLTQNIRTSRFRPNQISVHKGMVRLINGAAHDNTRKRSTHPASLGSRKMVRYIAAYHTRQYSKTFDTSTYMQTLAKTTKPCRISGLDTKASNKSVSPQPIYVRKEMVRLINGAAHDNTRKRSTHPASLSSRKMVRYIAAYHTRQYSKTFDTSFSELWPKLLSPDEFYANPVANVSKKRYATRKR